MTAQEAYDIFHNVVDLYRDEGITESEFSRHFNTAQFQLLDEDLSSAKAQGERESRNIELTQVIFEHWTPLIHEDLGAVSSASGVVSYQVLNVNFPDDVIRNRDGIVETKKPDIRHIMSYARVDSGGIRRRSKWVRYNEKEIVNYNPHTVGTDRFPNYYQSNNSLYSTPDGARQHWITLLRMPIHIWYEGSGAANNIDPELPDSTCLRVIERAIHLAGIHIREGFLVQAMNDR